MASLGSRVLEDAALEVPMSWRPLTLLLVLSTACTGLPGEGDGVVEDDEVPGPGWTAELVGTAHDVSGEAVVVDETTIEVRDFTYDGGGLNARFFLVVDGAPFDGALELTDDLVGTGPYDGETLTLPLPEAAEPGTWDALTLWCVPARVSFGFGTFRPPEG